MKKIYILLMHTDTIPAKIIKRATKYDYSHVGISLEKNCSKIYSFGRRKFNSILRCGFTIEEKHGDFFKKFHNTICKIYEIKVTSRQYRKIEKTLFNMTKHKLNYKYDFLGLVLRYWNIPLKIKNHYVCSYFVASLLEDAKIYKFHKKTCLVRPKDFESIPVLHKIYEGKYLRYE